MKYEVKNYVDDIGKNVIELKPFEDGEESKFMGKVLIQTPMGNMPIDIEFPEGYTLDKCFDEYDDFAKKRIEELKQEHEDQNRIIKPGDMKSPSNTIPFKQ